MTNRILLLIGIGGFIGSVARYLSQQLVSKYYPSTLPFGTLSVNALGCLIIGLVYGFSDKGNVLTPEWRLFLATGICGGFTTFSTFSYENLQLLRDGQIGYASIYVVLSVVLGLIATYGGYFITKLI